MDLFQFFARFHVLVLHLPIGILMLGALLEMASAFKGKERNTLLNAIWFWGAISAIGACVLGWMLSQGEGYNPDAVFLHRTYGIATASVAIISWLLLSRTSLKLAVYGLSSIQLLLLFFTGHYGANMTHGETYLVEHAPNPVRALVGLPAHAEPRPPISSLADADVYLDIVQPMLQKRCSSCHNDSKQKGGLSLANMDAILKGGKSGDTLVPGQADHSELYKRITLDHDDKEFMPAEGKKPLSDNQVASLKLWINMGAPFDGSAEQLVNGKQDTKLLKTLLGLNSDALPVISPLPDEAYSQLVSAGFVVKQLYQQAHYLDIDLSTYQGEFGEQQQTALAAASKHIVVLNLAKKMLDAPAIQGLAEFTNLHKLTLTYTEVETSALHALTQLEHLRYINLYGSNATDDIFAFVKEFPALENLYIGHTNISQEAVDNAYKILPLELVLTYVPRKISTTMNKS